MKLFRARDIPWTKNGIMYLKRPERPSDAYLASRIKFTTFTLTPDKILNGTYFFAYEADAVDYMNRCGEDTAVHIFDLPDGVLTPADCGLGVYEKGFLKPGEVVPVVPKIELLIDYEKVKNLEPAQMGWGNIINCREDVGYMQELRSRFRALNFDIDSLNTTKGIEPLIEKIPGQQIGEIVYDIISQSK